MTVRMSMMLISLSLFSAGCSSTTEIKTFPPGALVYVDGQLKGQTPCRYGDRGISGTTHKVRLELDGYKPLDSQVKKERLIVGRVLTSFLLPHLFYWFGYPDEYLYKLDPLNGQALTAHETPQPQPSRQ